MFGQERLISIRNRGAEGMVWSRARVDCRVEMRL